MTRLQARSVLVVVLLLASAGLMALNQSGRLAGVKGIASVPLTALQRGVAAMTGSVVRLFQRDADSDALRQRNAELEAQVASLQQQMVQLQENESELRILSALLDYARTQPEQRYAAANVIGRDSSPFLSYVIIDLGSDAGLRRDMPVVTNQGLVGSVVEVNCCAAKVRLIIDPSSAINARLQASRDEGVAVGQLAGGLELQYLSQQAQVKPGDLVLTSGLGGAYPPGIVIGSVSAVQRLDYEVLQKASLAPGVDFNRLEIVLVITNFKPLDLSPFVATEEPPAP
jgi:rod shape-determining protein MreC